VEEEEEVRSEKGFMQECRPGGFEGKEEFESVFLRLKGSISI
jgi:hypothetical protein